MTKRRMKSSADRWESNQMYNISQLCSKYVPILCNKCFIKSKFMSFFCTIVKCVGPTERKIQNRFLCVKCTYSESRLAVSHVYIKSSLWVAGH